MESGNLIGEKQAGWTKSSGLVHVHRTMFASRDNMPIRHLFGDEVGVFPFTTPHRCFLLQLFVILSPAIFVSVYSPK